MRTRKNKARLSAVVEGVTWRVVVDPGQGLIVRQHRKRAVTRIPFAELVDLAKGQRRLL